MDPITTAGDLIVGAPPATTGDLTSGTTTGVSTARLAAGTSGYVLTSNGPGAVPSYQAPSSGGGGGGGIYPALSKPVSSDFSWTNQLSNTVTDNSDRMTISMPTNGTDPNYRLFIFGTALPSPPYSIVAAFSMNDMNGSYDELTIGIRDSSSGKFVDLNLNVVSNGITVRTIRFNSVTSVSSVPSVTTITASTLYFLKITDDGTTRKFYFSKDGKDWLLVQSESTGTFITPNQCYIGCANFSGFTHAFSVWHWQMANSVL